MSQAAGKNKEKISPLIADDRRLRRIAEEHALEDSDFRRLYKIFEECDKDKGGTLDLPEFNIFIEERDSPFAQCILYDTISANRDKPIAFAEFAASIFTYGFYDKLKIQRFVFDAIDRDKSGNISRAELNEMMTWLHRAVFSNLRVALQNIEYDANDEVNWPTFARFTVQYPFVIFPAYRIQKTLRKKTFGERWWVRKEDEEKRQWNNKMRDELGIQKGLRLPGLDMIRKARQALGAALGPLQPPTAQELAAADARATARRRPGGGAAGGAAPAGDNDEGSVATVGSSLLNGMRSMNVAANNMANQVKDRAAAADNAYQNEEGEAGKRRKMGQDPEKMDLADLLKSASQPGSRKASAVVAPLGGGGGARASSAAAQGVELVADAGGESDLARRRKELERRLRDYDKLLQSVEVYDAHAHARQEERAQKRKQEKREKKREAKRRAKERADRRLQNTVLFEPSKHVGARYLVHRPGRDGRRRKKPLFETGEEDSDLSSGGGASP